MSVRTNIHIIKNSKVSVKKTKIKGIAIRPKSIKKLKNSGGGGRGAILLNISDI